MTKPFCLPTTVFTVILILINISSFAQADKLEKRKVVIQAPEVEKVVSDYPRWAVKINPLLITIGDFPVSLEYALTDWFSAEVALGITTTNYISNQVMDFDHEDLEKKTVPGMSFMWNIKLIPSADVYDDADYFALQYNNRTYRGQYRFDSDQTLSGVDEVLETSRNIQDIGLSWGVFKTTDIDNIFLEYYLGFTLRKEERIDLDYQYSSTGNELYYTSKSVIENTFGGLLGFKVGFLF